MYSSKGIINYRSDNSGLNVILSIDQEIAKYYRALLPKALRQYLRPQLHNTHISVVRKEPIIPNVDNWGKSQDKEIEFFYNGTVRNSERYFWIDAWSLGLEEIRKDLGLSLHSKFVKPADGFNHTFHFTIGNVKHLLTYS